MIRVAWQGTEPREHGNRKYSLTIVHGWRRMIENGEKTAQQIAKEEGLPGGCYVRDRIKRLIRSNDEQPCEGLRSEMR